MASEIVAGLGAFKAMFDLAKGLKDISDATARNAVAIELQEGILTAQAQQAALVERVGELEAEVARFETWEAEKQRYKLQRFEPGVFLWCLKEDAQPPEPGHSLCPNCYEQRCKSILQTEWKSGPIEKMYCPACKSDFTTGEHDSPGVTVAPDYNPLD